MIGVLSVIVITVAIKNYQKILKIALNLKIL